MRELWDRVLAWLLAGAPGAKTYVAAVGLIVMALVQACQGNYDLAAQSILAALAVLGVRHAIDRPGAKSPAVEQSDGSTAEGGGQ
ncbi:MAG: hypothetical protein IT429_25655 [Gemmataceae bacterium]|nr:hypothetical protein [Gemmataceae bacterium]